MAILIDTDILIDYLRGIPTAVAFVKEHSTEAHISAINIAELYQGVRPGIEQVKLAKTLFPLTRLPITSDTAELAGFYSRDFRPAHGCGLADCIVAATAHLHGLTLATLHSKYLPMLQACQSAIPKTLTL
jgi:predicted nucleic acid-binding protein